MEIKQKVNIHNRFDVHIDNIETGEHRELVGYNIILDRMWTRLCGGSSYFGYIHFGTGTGTPTPEGTSLFSHLGTKSAVTEEIIKALPVSSWKRKIVLNPEEYVEETITEVGIAYSSSASSLVTHAMLKDSEGNAISITKTSTDVVTIYATVFITFGSEQSEITFTNMPSDNGLVNYMTGSSFPSGSFAFGEHGGVFAGTGVSSIGSYPALGTSPDVSWSSNLASKKRVSSTVRVPTTGANGHMREFAFSNVWRAPLVRAGAYEGQPYSNVVVGVGDGVKQDFVLPSKNVKDTGLTIKINGVATTEYTKENIELGANYRMNVLSPSYGTELYDASEALSADGSVYAYGIKKNNVGAIRLYRRQGGSYVEDLNVPTDLATDSSYDYNNVCLSNQADVLACCSLQGTEPLSVYDLVVDDWIKRPVPTEMNYITRCIDISGDGNTIIVGQGTDSAKPVDVFDWDGTEWTKRAAMPIPNQETSAVFISDDGNVIGIQSSSSRFYVLDWDGTTWTSRLMSGQAYITELGQGYMSKDGRVVAGSRSSVVKSYEWDGTTWLVRPTFTLSTPYQVGLNFDGTLLGIGSYSAGTFYKRWVDGAWIDVAVRGASNRSYGHTWSKDGSVLAVSSSSVPLLYDWSKLWTKITFNTVPADGAVITADYTVDGLHKTDQYIIDLSFAVQFGEGV